MHRFIGRATHPTPNARPDLMPLGGVLLALVAIFAPTCRRLRRA